MANPSADAESARSYRGIPFGPPWAHPAAITARLAEQAKRQPGAAFVTAVARDGRQSTMTYRDLDRQSARMACWLGRELNVPEGGIVALIPLNDIESIAAIFGILRAGCAVVLLSPADPIARLTAQASALDVAAVLRGPEVAADVFPTAIAVPREAALPDVPASWREPVIDPAADALFFGTSGSTATSKLVAQSHYNAVINAAAVTRHHALRPGDRLLACLPIHHVNGLHFTVFGTLFAGAHVMFANRFEPLGYPGLLRTFRPRIASVVPNLLEALLETWRTPALPDGFGYFVTAAAPLPAATASRAWEAIGARIVQGYGLSETTNFSTTMPADLPAWAYQMLMTRTEIPSAGVALPGNEVSVLRPDGSPAGLGETGEICMRGHNVMTRYAGNPEATARAFRSGWFHSEDLGFVTALAGDQRRFLVITGRSKNIAKVGGESVSLDEMDRQLMALPDIKDAACVSVPSRFHGEEIIAAVVLAGEVDVRQELRGLFSAAVLPRTVVHLPAIPRTGTGKVLRPELARMLTAYAEKTR